jgi:alkanesulfonate monooxygenase SsuD/methylene tetrahydromethanopterin reductase-like flavin-dependent oxidoreductase (luciferase family)
MARVVASLDVASGGRIIFGVGVGWMQEEFDLLGVPYTERAPRTREYLRVMKEVWTNESPRFNGKYVQIDKDLHFAPKPTQKPHPPIWVGGESTPALKRVVEFGQGWHIGPVDIEDVRPRFDELKGLMDAAGRNYADLEITWMVDNSRTDAAAIRAYRDLGVHGLYVTAASADPNEVCAIMREFPKKVQDAVG